MSDMTLPVCHVQYPRCGACGTDTKYDGDVFVCWGCGLSYGDGEDCTVAEYFEEDAETCAVPCSNFWHGPHMIRQGGGYDCNPCALPHGHENMHWTNCQPIELSGATK